jgi:hypothetical protein
MSYKHRVQYSEPPSYKNHTIHYDKSISQNSNNLLPLNMLHKHQPIPAIKHNLPDIT